MLKITRTLLRLLNIGNWLCGCGFVLLIAALAVRPGLMAARFGPAAADGAHLGQIMLAIGIAMVVATHFVFVPLIAIVDTVRAGQPFTRENGRRLRDIAWALLAIQIVDAVFGIAAMRFARMLGETSPWSPGLTGWLAVLLLFVLARVFAQAAEMQDELDGTV